MLYRCNKIKEIKGCNNCLTINVNNMKALFYECYNLEYLDLSNFNTSNNMDCIFCGCYVLKKIKGINKFNTNKISIMRIMFQDLSNF